MNLKAINTMIDSEAVSQNNIFSHSLSDYEKIYNYIVDTDIETSKEDEENLIKKVAVLQRPIAEFVNACLTNKQNPNNDILLKSLIDKSVKAQKFEYSAYFSDVAIRINPINKYALNIKAVSLKKMDASIEEQKQAIEKYLEQDLDDTKFLFELSELHKKEGKIENAIIDLKKAVQRSIQKQDFHELKINTLELDSMLDLNSKSYIVSTLSRGAKKIGPEKMNTLFFELERRNADNTEYSIKLLKEMLSIDSKNTKAKNILIEQYKKLYNNSEHCLKCLEKSGLLQDVNTTISVSIANFEKLIMFEEGVFVYHADYDIGRVAKVEPDSLVINFVTKANHKMSTDMTLKSLTILQKDNIRVLKKFANKDKLHDKMISDTRWGFVTMIKSGYGSLKAMKEELVPEILSAAEFQNFQQDAKKIAKQDPFISPSMLKSDEYILRDTPITHEEKFYISFKNETNIFEKMKIVRNFLQTEGDKESECFLNMLAHFQQFIKYKTNPSNYVYSYLFLSELKRSKHKVKVATSSFPANDKEVFEFIPESELINWYLDIQDNEICKSYIRMITKSSDNWSKILSDIFLKAPSVFISNEFKKMKVDNFDTEKKKQSVFIAKQNPLPFLHYLKLDQSFDAWKDVCDTEYNFITVQLDILDTFSQKSSISNQIYQSLITSGYLEKYISTAKKDFLHSLYRLISKNRGIGDEKKANFKSYIADIGGDEFKKEIENKDSAVSSIPTALLCKQSTYDKKKAELEHIMNVEIPKNAEDIGNARELGDLKENAEYQYAKEKQKLLNTTMNKLVDEIAKAAVVKKEDVDTSKVCYGTKVEIKNADGSVQEYTMLGPWESEPDNNIISFQSPLGKKLYNHIVGDNLDFSLNNHPYKFSITKISAVDIS